MNMTNITLQAVIYASATTLSRIRAVNPCGKGWAKLLAHLGKTSADDEPLNLLAVLDSNGLDDAIWVLSFAMPDDRLARHFQAWCADQVLHLFEAEFPEDTRVRDQIAMLRNDDASPGQRYAARDAAWATARDAAWDASRYSSAGRPALAAARDAAQAAAQAAAWVAARDAAWADAWVAAQAIARSAQERQLRSMIGGAA
jgi:hypothetical protein